MHWVTMSQAESSGSGSGVTQAMIESLANNAFETDATAGVAERKEKKEKRKRGRYPLFLVGVVGPGCRAAEIGILAVQRRKRLALRFREIHPEIGEADGACVTVSTIGTTKEGR